MPGENIVDENLPGFVKKLTRARGRLYLAGVQRVAIPKLADVLDRRFHHPMISFLSETDSW
jgi:hypothetical protein